MQEEGDEALEPHAALGQTSHHGTLSRRPHSLLLSPPRGQRLLKPASWRAPFVKGPSAVRGYVTDSTNGMGSVTPYGIAYAR